MNDEMGNPFIERPDEHPVGAADEVYCWMPSNDARECNSSCVAYNPETASDGRPCMALEMLRQLVTVATDLVPLLHKRDARARTEAVKQIVDNLPPPPEVR